jgi:competence protein ComEC
MASFGTGPLIASTIGIVALGLLRTPLRWSGAIIIAISILWSLVVKPPDILISGDGHNVGVRGRDGRLHLMRSAKDTFMIKEWLAADADGRLPADSSLAEGVSCDGEGCAVQMSDGGIVALAQRPEALMDDCVRAEVIVTPWQAPDGCRALVIDREKLLQQGAMALRRTRGSGNGSEGHHLAIDAIRPHGVDRPWSPAVAGEKSETVAFRGAPTHPIDATPAAADLQPEE